MIQQQMGLGLLFNMQRAGMNDNDRRELRNRVAEIKTALTDAPGVLADSARVRVYAIAGKEHKDGSQDDTYTYVSAEAQIDTGSGDSTDIRIYARSVDPLTAARSAAAVACRFACQP